MGVGSKKGSGYGGMRTVLCPRCGCNYKKSYAQINSGNPVCLNTVACQRRADKKRAKTAQAKDGNP